MSTPVTMFAPPTSQSPRRRRIIRLSLLLVALCLLPHAWAQVDEFQAALAQARRLPGTAAPDEVVAAFQRAAQLAPETNLRAQAWYELSRYHEASRRYRESAEVLEQIAALDPPSVLLPSALDQLARTYQRFDPPRAIRAYQRLAESPGVEEGLLEAALWGQARVLQQIGDLPRAAQAAEKLLARFPESRYAGQANGLRVEAAVDRKDLPAARGIAEAEASRDTGNAGLLLRVASELRQAGDIPGALEVLESCSRRMPDNLTVEEMIYEIHRDAGSLADYEKQLRAQAEPPASRDAALRRLAGLYDRGNQPAQALQVLRQILADHPDDTDLLARAARCASQSGDPRSAESYYQQALRANPDNARVRSELGDLYLAAGERDKALEQWKRAARYDPENAFTAQMLGRSLHDRGLYADAVDVYQETREALQDPAAMALELGEEYEALLLIDRAVEEYLRAMAPGQPAAGIARIRLEALAADQVVGPEVVRELNARVDQPDFPAPALVALGIAHLSGGDSQNARGALARLGERAEDATLVVGAASMLEEQDRVQAALELYDVAAQMPLDPGMAGQVAQRRASLLLAGGQWREALRILEDAAEMDMPETVADPLRLQLADLLVMWAGDWAEAADLYSAVARESASPQDRWLAAWGLADCAFIEGRYAEARAAYEALAPEAAATAHDLPPPAPFEPVTGPVRVLMPSFAPPGFDRPTGPDYATFQLAEIDFRTGEFKPALQRFRQVSSRYPASPFANDALARELLIRSEFTGESPLEGKLIEALALADRGEYERANRVLGMVAELGVDEPLADDAALLRARNEARFGQAEDAARRYQAIRDEFPDSPLWPGALLRAAELLGRNPESRQEALDLLRALIADAPDSPEAAQAQLGIDRLSRD